MRRREAIFEAKVDYRGQRTLSSSSEDRQVEDIVIRTLLDDLPRELRSLFDLEVHVRITGTRYHSLSVFFAVAMGAYGILSGYKGLLESMDLIREQADTLLTSALGRVGDMTVSVYRRYPSDLWPDPEFHHMRRKGLLGFRPPEFLPEHAGVQRDGFFWFLLVVCLVESAVIALLVYGAVMKSYFGAGG